MEKLIKPKLNHVKEIHKIINDYAKERLMLPRSLFAIYENIRDFLIVIDDQTDSVLGCGALHVAWEDLAEIKSLAILKDVKRKGYGKLIVEGLMKEAKELGIKKVFALTYVPDFFKKFDFIQIDRDTLPHKIWAECIHCPYFPNCNEIALIKEI